MSRKEKSNWENLLHFLIEIVNKIEEKSVGWTKKKEKKRFFFGRIVSLYAFIVCCRSNARVLEIS